MGQRAAGHVKSPEGLGYVLSLLGRSVEGRFFALRFFLLPNRIL
jgi:hypothetical protein